MTSAQREQEDWETNTETWRIFQGIVGVTSGESGRKVRKDDVTC